MFQETLWNKSHGLWSILLSPKDFHIHLSFLVTHRSMSLWIPFFWHFHRTLLGSSMAHKHKEPANGTCFTHRVVNQPVSAEKPTYVTGNASICVNFHLCWISCPDVDPRHSKAVVTAGLYYSSWSKGKRKMIFSSRGMLQLLVFEKGNPKSSRLMLPCWNIRNQPSFNKGFPLQKAASKRDVLFWMLSKNGAWNLKRCWESTVLTWSGQSHSPIPDTCNKAIR